MVYSLDYYAYYLKLVSAAVLLLPLAILCYLVNFHTCSAAIEQMLLYVDYMGCCALYKGLNKKARPRYNCCLLAMLGV